MNKKTTKVCLVFFLLFICYENSLFAGVTGSLAGFVTDASSKRPLRGAQITVVSTGKTSISDKHGHYVITGLPPGTYEIKVDFIGYAATSYEEVLVKSDITTLLNFALTPFILRTEPIIITGLRSPIRQETTSTTHYINNRDLTSHYPVDNYIDSFKFLPGIFANHFRGARAGDVMYLIDGVPMIRPLTRGIGLDIPSSAIEDIVVSTGGFSAEYGNANAGIVNIIRKRARNNFEFSARSYTDNFGVSNLDHDNNRRFQIGLGGPLTMSFGGPVLEMNYYISVDANFSDTPYREKLRSVFDEAMFKNLNASAVYDLKLSKNINLSLRTALSRWRWREFDESGAEPVETTPLRENKNVSSSIGVTHTLSPSMFYSITFGYNRFRDFVFGQNLAGLDPLIFANDPQPVRGLDLAVTPWFQRTAEEVFFVHAKTFKQIQNTIQVKAGISAEYYDVSMDAQRFVAQPNRIDKKQEDFRYTYTKFTNNFRHYPYAFAGYAEARIKLPFFTGQFGMRADYLEPNAKRNEITALERTIPGNKEPILDKLTFSPRIALSLPLSERDLIYFNYGKYAQLPALYQLYAGEDITSSTQPYWTLVGNTELKLTKSINYELAYGRELTRTSFKITGFYREFSNLIDSNTTSRLLVNKNIASIYDNGAFGRARGFEIQFTHKIKPNIFGRVIYTYMKSTGTSNYPEENFAQLIRSGFINDSQNESALNWDQRHSLMLLLSAKISNVHVTASSRFYSARDWLARSLTKNQQDGVDQAKLPLRSLMDIKAFYEARTGPFRIAPYIEIRNLFNVQYRESRDDVFLFNSQPVIPFQEQFGRRLRVGVQIN